MTNKRKTETRRYAPFSIGEHLLMSLVSAMISERYPAGGPVRVQMESWAKENFPALLKEANETGDLAGPLISARKHLEAVLSKKEAELRLVGKATGLAQNKEAIAKAIRAGDWKRAIETKASYLLRFKELRDLKHPTVQKCIDIAKQGDERLLIRLGRLFQQKAKSIYDGKFDRLEWLMVRYWAKGPNGQIGLNRLTDEALTEFFSLALGRDYLNLAAVRKVRQRLRLKKGPEPWLTKVEKTEHGITIS